MQKASRPNGRPREEMSAKKLGKRVLALKAKGLSFGAVGKRMGFSRQRAHAIYTRILAEQRKAA